MNLIFIFLLQLCEFYGSNLQDFSLHYKKHEKELVQKMLKERKEMGGDAKLKENTLVLPVQSAMKLNNPKKKFKKNLEVENNVNNLPKSTQISAVDPASKTVISDMEKNLSTSYVETIDTDEKTQTRVITIRLNEDEKPNFKNLALVNTNGDSISEDAEICIDVNSKNSLILTNSGMEEHEAASPGIPHVIVADDGRQFFINVTDDSSEHVNLFDLKQNAISNV